MFTQAGINLRGRAICRARIGYMPGRPVRWAVLWRFESGDVAWVSRHFFAWPHSARIYNVIGNNVYSMGVQDSCRLERS